VDQIIDPKFLLRLVNKKSVEYLKMLDSIERTGLWNSICVRPAGDRGPDLFEVIDGFYRLTCCRELRRETVPAIIRHGVTDQEVLAAQIQANALRPETTKVEYAKQLKRIEAAFPGITMPELAVMVGQNPEWVSLQLDLLELSPNIQKLVDRGDIPITSAYMLAKVPLSYQKSLVDPARVMPAAEFKALAAGIIKRFMEQVRQGKLDKRFNDRPFEPVPWYRGHKELLAEINTPSEGPSLLVAVKAMTPLEGFIKGLEWAMHLDPASVEKQRKAAEGRSRADLRKLYRERKADVENLDQ
jgi:ParB/RepB/Spo0J family partition protein